MCIRDRVTVERIDECIRLGIIAKADLACLGGHSSSSGQQRWELVTDLFAQGPKASGQHVAQVRFEYELIKDVYKRQVQDLALGPEGRMVLLDRFVDRGIQVYGPDGQLLNDVPLSGKTELGSLTGVFADERGIYVEREHGMVQRVADANGNRTSGDRELPGRPSRDGQLVIAAAMLDRQSGQDVYKRQACRSSSRIAPPCWRRSWSVSRALPSL